MDGKRIIKILAIALLGIALTLLALVWTDAVAPGLAGPDESTQTTAEDTASPTNSGPAFID